MAAIRSAHRLTRWVLVWFALSLGVAMAAPFVAPQGMQVVCSASGAMKMVFTGDDGSPATSAHTLECPLCAPTGAPPPQTPCSFAAPAPLAYALQHIPAARIAAITAAPLPARGPPARY